LGFFVLSAETSFGSLDIDHDTLLFSAQVQAPVYGTYTAAFMSKIDTKALQALSYFPEGLTWLGASQELQIQNRFGVFRSKGIGGKFELVKGFTNFFEGGEIRTGQLGAVQTSPDGKYLVYLRETSPAYGDLVLLDVVSGSELTLAKQVELSLKTLKLSWAPDSRVLVYQKNNTLYYFSLEQQKSGRLLDESLRTLGPGQISSIQWGPYNQLIYINGSLVYEILSAELFTRSLYQDFLKIGRIIGTLPQSFDPLFDRFWISPDGTKVLLNKAGTNLFLFLLNNDQRQASLKVRQLPYLLLPDTMRIADLVWTQDDQITILTKTRGRSNEQSLMYRLNAKEKEYTFEELSAPFTRKIQLSPDGNSLALLGNSAIQFRKLSDWSLVQTLEHPDPEYLIFINSQDFIVAGRWYAEKCSLISGKLKRETLFLSQIEAFGFDANTGKALAKTKDKAFVWDADKNIWQPSESFKPRKAQTASENYRVYLEQLYSGPYNNLVMLRKTNEPGTFQLFNPPQTVYENFPSAENKDDTPDFDYFQHGDRQRKRELALTFNAIDSIDGLDQILSTLADYNVKATFFLNGEFIRRYPWAAKEIADAGHEVGSLFYMYFRMADPRYQISADFIKQGLARNEQDYYDATGKELTLLWRTPYYIVNDMILNAGKALNYTLVGKDVDSLDSISRGQDGLAADLYYPAANLIERILKQKKPGSIIAMTVGRPGLDENPGLSREDYLFNSLDILINNLLQRGYSIVPVSSLIEALR